jgi:hypothetical protein
MTKPFKKCLISAAFFWLALAVILFIFNSIKSGSLPNLETLLSVLIVLLVATPLLGGLFYLQDRLAERSRREVLDRRPFTDFLANGFDIRDKAVVGIIKGYTIVIDYEAHPPPYIEIKVLFDPVFQGRELTDAELEQIYSTKKSIWKEQSLFWLPYFMMCKIPIVFKKLPDYEKVNERINFIIDIFRKGNLKPVDYEFYEKHYPKHLFD